MKIVVRTETWKTATGPVARAVVRDEKGRLLGATNQTTKVPTLEVVGRK